MSQLRGLSIAEKIVWLFEHRVTEAHRSAIERPLNITPEQFDGAIPRARELGTHVGLRITPIYDEGREGWWTARPTLRLATKAIHESNGRNLGEATRNSLVYRGFGHVEKAATFTEAALAGARSAIENDLPELYVNPRFDYVLERIDEAIARGKGFVPREPLVVEAAA